MNCPEFEACLLDLVAERSPEDFLRAKALSHANVCSRCAARLVEEQALAAGSRVLASGARHASAPAHVEEALVKKFRELERAKAEVPTPLPDIQSPKAAWWKTPGYVGLAASVLLLLGWMLIQSPREAGMDGAQVIPSPEYLPMPKPPTHSEDKPVATLKVMPEPSSKPVRKPARPAKTRALPVSTPMPEARLQYAARPSGQSERRLREAESAANDRVETEFLPFMIAGPEFLSEQRQFVRVKLPRSALQVFGLPMNMERAREPVQADVLLGEDGRALAVRFIRD